MKLHDLRFVADADVYKAGSSAATLRRDSGGTTTFEYDADYLRRGGAPVSLSLPVGAPPVETTNGGLPVTLLTGPFDEC